MIPVFQGSTAVLVDHAVVTLVAHLIVWKTGNTGAIHRFAQIILWFLFKQIRNSLVIFAILGWGTYSLNYILCVGLGILRDSHVEAIVPQIFRFL